MALAHSLRQMHAPTHAPCTALPLRSRWRRTAPRCCTEAGATVSRRHALQAAGALSLPLLTPYTAGAAQQSQLAELFAQAAPVYPGPSFAYVKQLLYPRWLFGDWSATSELVSFDAPKGTRYVPASAVAAAESDRGRSVAFRARFFQTLPDTAANALRVTLGSVPESAVVADRAYNIKSLTEATLGREGAVESVVYDPTNASDRVTVTYAGARPSRGELYLSALRGDDLQGDSPVFHTAECIRQVFLGGERRETVTDYQVLCRFQRNSPDDVMLTQKVAVYLQPQEVRSSRAPPPGFSSPLAY